VISIVLPVYNPPEAWLAQSIDSVFAQAYSHWELCIADDASTAPHVRPLLERYAATDRRIKVAFRTENGHISAASNSALALATGDWVALLDHDDALAPHALYEVAAMLNARPETDLIYSDEDKIDRDGHRHSPYFKPEFLPDLFTGQNYISHLTVLRTALVRDLGGFRIGFEGSQDWDLALRYVERIKPERIRHIPKVLYHWRAVAGSTALLPDEKTYYVEAARKALGEHFARRGEAVELLPVAGGHWRVKHRLSTPAPFVSLIVPTRNGVRLLRRCVDSILEKTTYPAYEIIIVDNGSDDPETLAYLRALEARAGAARVRVLRDDSPFNYSALNNRAVRSARGPLVGLLNNDLEVINGDWLEEMASQAARPGIGCVGAMLYYPNNTIQHAGVVLGVGGVAAHAFRDLERGSEGRFNRARLVQNYSAVTAACLVIRQALYEEVGGLDETELAVAFNDIDFCLKVRAAGYRNLWTPFAELYHHESASRGADDTEEKRERFRRETETMLARWGEELAADPAYNPNLTLELTDFSLAALPRSWKPWQTGEGRLE
jgi:glycosyltransferase involved in cell wall biosynthesis